MHAYKAPDDSGDSEIFYCLVIVIKFFDAHKSSFVVGVEDVFVESEISESKSILTEGV